MLQVTTLLIFSILMGQVIPTEVVDTKLNLFFPEVHHTQDINQDDSDLICSESAYEFDQLYCKQSAPLLAIRNCATYNKETKYYPFSNVLTFSLIAIMSLNTCTTMEAQM